MPVPPRYQDAARIRPGTGPQAAGDQEDWPVDRGRPLGLRLLALLGAFAFLMLGLSVIAPLLSPRPQTPVAPKGSDTAA